MLAELLTHTLQSLTLSTKVKNTIILKHINFRRGLWCAKCSLKAVYILSTDITATATETDLMIKSWSVSATGIGKLTICAYPKRSKARLFCPFTVNASRCGNIRCDGHNESDHRILENKDPPSLEEEVNTVSGLGDDSGREK